ncbi:MAG: Hsp20/alpha crystallin family protein [Oligoflexia bacterium]|nr:Hsp20/alpha crystallin family protein [Oligoflexia bacterium]
MRYDLAKSGNKKSLFDVFFGDRFYDEFVNLPSLAQNEWRPSVDIVEKEDKFVVTADLPGIDQKDINVELKDGILTIKGERKNEVNDEKDNVCRCERFYGSFSRSFNVYDVDEEKISANYKNGTLTLDLPKSERKKAKSIEIKAA